MFASVTLAFLAASSAPPATTATPQVKPMKEKKVCVSENVMGSIMPKRVCRTQAEWEVVNKENARRSVELPSRNPIRN